MNEHVNQTTIGLSFALKNELKKRKIIPAETYESLIWRILEEVDKKED